MAQRRGWLLIGESTGHLIDTLRVLVARELRMRYKGSFLGITWAILSPIGTVIILQFVFETVLKMGIPNFAIFMYTALLPWTWFANSVLAGATTLTGNRDLVRTPFFAKSLLPAVVTCANFLMYLLALPVLLGLMVANGVPLTRALIALPVIWIAEAMLTLAFTVLIAAIGVLVHDVQHLMAVLMQFWFYLTPIFYDLSRVPPELTPVFTLNPMASIVTAHRAVTLYGRFPDWEGLAYTALGSAALLGVSLFVFRTLEDAFIEAA